MRSALRPSFRSAFWRRAARAACACALLRCFSAAPATAQDVAPSPGPSGLVGERIASHARMGVTSRAAIAARVEAREAGARLIFELYGDGADAPLAVTSYAATRPNRLVIELPALIFQLDPTIGAARPGQQPVGGVLQSYRFGLFAPGRSRVVLDLARPARLARAQTVVAPEGARLEIDLAETDSASFARDAATGNRLAAAAEPPAQTPPAGSEDKPLIIIDPGHGGVDHGASSKHGETEKSIVLDFARVLKDKIEAQGALRVMLTRADDVFVTLNDRVRFARQNKAALFVSIHADTLGEPQVSGATVYTVSAKASDAEAAKTAAKENLADEAAGLERQQDAEDVGDILLDLARRETRALSRRFAELVVGRWRTAGSLNKNPSRSAGFVVLKAYDVPSVLLELGYLSSESDLARLTSPEWRDKATASTAQAIADYFAARPAVAPQNQALAAQRRQQ